MIDPLAPRHPLPTLDFEAGDVVFVCEGGDECAVVRELTRHWPRRPKIGTRDDRARRSWGDELRALAKQVPARGIRAIGFVWDAEDSADRAEQDLRTVAQEAGIALPPRPLARDSADVDDCQIATGFIVNPGLGKSGAIEDLFLPQIERTGISSCIDALLQCYEEAEPSCQRRGKLVVRTYLAHKNAYNTGLRIALRDGHLSVDTEEFALLREFVSLFQSA